MTFPDVIVDLRAELLLAGTWTDISDYVFNNEDSPGITITRGQADESPLTNTSECVMRLNNSDGRFTSRNPSGAYYPDLVMNTQVRVSVPEGASYLRIEDDQVSGATAPDSAGLSITGDTEIQIDVTLDNWRQDQVLAGKWVATSNQRSWALELEEDGVLRFSWSSDGTTGAVFNAESSVPVPVPALRRQAIKVTLATGTGTVTYYTAGDINGTWTQLGDAQVLGAKTVFDATAGITLGYIANNQAPFGVAGMNGKIHAFNLLSGIGGTVKADPDFTTQTAGAGSFSDGTNTWTVHGTAELSDRDYRFHGEVAAWPKGQDPTGTYVWVDVTANGLLRRLSGTNRPIQSAMRRYWTKAPLNAPVAYWSMEEGSNAAGFASGLAGDPAMQFVFGTHTKPDFAADSDFECSDPLPVLNGTAWTGKVPGYTAGTGHQLMALIDIPAAGDVTNTILLEADMTSPDVGKILLRYSTALAGTLACEQWTPDSGQLRAGTSPGYAGANGQQLLVGISIDSAGATALRVAAAGAVSSTVATDTGGSAITLGKVTAVDLNYELTLATDTAVGHVAVIADASTAAFEDALSALAAYADEAAGDRFQRLCEEEGITFRGQGQMSASTPMGFQTEQTPMTLLQECATADMGIMYEPRQCGLALGYRTRSSLYDQDPAAAFTYTSAHLAGEFQPTDDDQTTANDVTATRTNGSSFRTVLASGPLSVLAPPDGVGTYDTDTTLNLFADGQLMNAAGWMLHLGTVNEDRWPLIQFDLARAATASLVTSLQRTDLGDVYSVGDTPDYITPDGITQIVKQQAERLGGYIWQMDWAGAPASPYQVFTVEDDILGHIDTGGSDLHSSATSTAGSLSVDSDDALWTTTATAGWSFTASGSPGDAVHFIVTTAQSASISVGDIFTDTTNTSQAFKVTAISAPFAGFVNISFTPAAGTNMNNPDVVTQNLGDFPFDINIAGERITVAKITGSSSPQTFLVVRSVNGVVKAQSSGAAVNLFTRPAIAW